MIIVDKSYSVDDLMNMTIRLGEAQKRLAELLNADGVEINLKTIAGEPCRKYYFNLYIYFGNVENPTFYEKDFDTAYDLLTYLEAMEVGIRLSKGEEV